MQTSAIPPELDWGKGTAGSEPTRSPFFSVNSVVAGRFRIRRFLGQGGLGQVFAAEDLLLGQPVGLKTLHPALARNPEAVEVLIQEVTLARKVTHPNVCRIYELFEHRPLDQGSVPERVLVLTMELIEGESLRDHLERRGSLPPATALELASQIASALDAVHEAGVVHGDLTPANVLLEARGGETRALLADFGLASLATSPRIAAGGTRAYMAPERRQGQAITAAADIYAFGVLLREMLGHEMEPCLAGSDAPVRLSPALQGCLAESPEDRPSSASSVVEALRESLKSSKRRGRTFARLALLASLCLALMSFERAEPGFRSPSPNRSHPSGATRESSRPSILVRDFQDLSSHKGSLWLSSALAELLTSHLAAGESIAVYPHRDVAPEHPSVSARWRIDGAYLVDGTGVHVRIELVDSTEGRVYADIDESGSVDTLFDLIERLNLQLRAALGAPQPSPGERATVRGSLPRSVAALKAYSSGRDLLRRSEYSEARRFLLEALDLEPDFALTRSALAETLDALGYRQEARTHAAEALALSADLPREERLRIEGLHARLIEDWARAEEVARALWVFFPEQSEYGLELARIQNQAGAHRRALETVGDLRTANASESPDPRLDLEAARAHFALAEYPEALSFALSAEQRAQHLGWRQSIASAQVLLADIHLLIGDLGAAEDSVRRATSSVAKLRNPRTRAQLWLLVGDTHQNVGNLSEAARLFQQAIDFYRTTEDRRSLAISLSRLATVLGIQGRPEAATELLEQSLSILRELEDLENVSGTLGMLASHAMALCDLEQAHARYAEALQIARELDSPRRLAETLNNLSELELALGRGSMAALHLTEAHDLAVSMGNPMGETITLLNLAQLDLDNLQLVRARARLERTAALAQELDAPFLQAYNLVLEGEMARIQGQPEEAKSRIQKAIAMYEEIGSRVYAALGRKGLARVELEAGELDDAARHAEIALRVLREMNQRGQVPAAAATVSSIAVAMGQPDRARVVLREAEARQGSCPNRESELALLQAEARILAAEGDPSAAISKLDALLESPTDVRPPLRERLELLLLRESIESGDPRALTRLASQARESGHLAVARKAAALATAQDR